MAIAPAGYGQKAALLTKLEPKLPKSTVPKPYNPLAYVPGGSSQASPELLEEQRGALRRS